MSISKGLSRSLGSFGLSTKSACSIDKKRSGCGALNIFKHIGCSCSNGCLFRTSKHTSKSSHF